MSKIIKHNNNDKYDQHMPNKPEFIHDDYYVSNQQELFHISSAYAYRGKFGDGFSVGIQKSMWRASGRGIQIDGSSVGKSDS